MSQNRGNPNPVGNHGSHEQKEIDCPNCGQPAKNLPRHMRGCDGDG